MKVVCCFTRLHPDTARTLTAYAPETELVLLDQDDDFGYWRTLADRWARGTDLLVIEQDIVISPGTVAGFAACSGRSDWCAAPYPAYDGYPLCNERALGCTRFSARVQDAIPAESFRAPWPVLADRFIAMFDPLYPHQHQQVGHRHPLPEGAIS